MRTLRLARAQSVTEPVIKALWKRSWERAVCPDKTESKTSNTNEMSVVLDEDDWHYVIAKLRKAIEPRCYEKTYCQLLEVVAKIEREVKEAMVERSVTRAVRPFSALFICWN